MTEAIGNPLRHRFIKDLIVQILAMISEQERTESKRRQSQGIKLAQKKAYTKDNQNCIARIQRILSIGQFIEI